MSTLLRFLQAPRNVVRVFRHARKMRGKISNPWHVSWNMLKSKPTLCTAILRDGSMINFRNINGDISVVQELLVNDTYGPLVKRLPFNVSRVIDIGAHIGCFTVSIARRVELIVAVEPEPGNFTLLEMNVKDNGLTSRVRTLNAAAGSSNGSAKLFRDSKQSVLNSLNSKGPHSNDLDSVEVNVISLSCLIESLDGNPCDLLKIDCEGAEYGMLFNSPRSTFDKIKSIIMEVHASDSDDHTPGLLAKMLRSMGYNVECTPSEIEHSPSKHISYGHGLGLLIAVRNDC